MATKLLTARQEIEKLDAKIALLHARRALLISKYSEEARVAPNQTIYCSFCSASQYDRQHMIAGPTAYICSDCIACSMTLLTGNEDAYAIAIKSLSYSEPR